MSDMLPGPGHNLAVPWPVPPLGDIGPGSIFSLTFQLPAIILIILVISGAGLGMGIDMPAASFALAFGLSPFDIVSCAAIAIQQSPHITIRIAILGMLFIVAPV